MLKNPFFLFGLGVLLLVVFLPSYQTMQDLKQKNREYELRIQGLVRENAKLDEERKMLEHDPAYLEKVAREKMGLMKKGDVIYKIVPEDTKK